MESKIIEIRNWIRTNGVMSEDGKHITYNCIEIEKVIKKALLQTDVISSRIKELEEENKKLHLMIKNALGYEDMVNDCL